MTLERNLNEAAFWDEQLCLTCGEMDEYCECGETSLLVPAQPLRGWLTRLLAERDGED